MRGRLKDVRVVERRVACDEHSPRIEQELNEKKAAYTVEDEWIEPCCKCGKTGMNRAYPVVDGPGLRRFSSPSDRLSQEQIN